MKLAISNIAWSPENARNVYGLMRQHGFTGLEIAPSLAFPDEADPFTPSIAAISALHRELTEFGLELVSMQSLLFGVPNAQLFGTSAELANFEQSMLRAIRMAEQVGIPILVFGSPKNRAFPEDMPAEQAFAHAGEVFRRLGDRALAAGTRIAIEPNPAAYGTNFLNGVAGTAQFVAGLDHPGITLNYDLGALYLNAETANAGPIYRAAHGRVSHVHISEPNLAAAPADPKILAGVVQTLLQLGYSGWFSLEMRPPNGNPLDQIATCLATTARCFAGLGSLLNA